MRFIAGRRGNVRVVLTHDSPLSLCSVRTPLLPVLCAVTILSQTLLLSTDDILVVDEDHRAGLVRPGGRGSGELDVLNVMTRRSEGWKLARGLAVVIEGAV